MVCFLVVCFRILVLVLVWFGLFCCGFAFLLSRSVHHPLGVLTLPTPHPDTGPYTHIQPLSTRKPDNDVDADDIDGGGGAAVGGRIGHQGRTTTVLRIERVFVFAKFQFMIRVSLLSFVRSSYSALVACSHPFGFGITDKPY